MAMDNRDYRERLRSHEVEPSRPAWEQMEGMLDAIPEKNDKRRKRFPFWFFLLLGVISIAGSLWISEMHIGKEVSAGHVSQNANSSPTSTVNIETEDILVSESDATTKRIANETTTKTYQQQNAEKSNQVLDVDNQPDENVLANKARKLNSSTQSRPNDILKRTTSLTDLDDNSSKTDQESKESTPYKIETSTKQNGESNVTTGKSYPQSKNENNADNKTESLTAAPEDFAFPSEDKNPSKGTEPDSMMAASSDEQSRKTLQQISIIDPIDPMLATTPYDMGKTKVIRNIGPSRFHWLIGAGYAEFNNNPGLIFSGGILYDVDRIIDLEVNTSYVFGRGPAIVGIDSITKEQQFDLNLLVHLNFLKNNKHKLSLDLGGGHTSYSGQRLIQSAEPTIDVRSSSGRNLQMAVSYHYSLDHNSKLGLRLGVISYDDAVVYISTRYLKRF